MTDSTATNDVIGAIAGGGTAGEDPLQTLVGDGKKFRTVEDLARGKLESDAFIAKLQSENNELRTLVKSVEAKANTSTALEEILKRVSTPGSTPAPGASTADQTPTHNQPVGLTREDVVNLLNEQERSKVASENYKIANQRLIEAFGTKATEVVTKRASELGISPLALKTMAETSPKAFLALIGADRETNPGYANRTGGVNRGSVNTAAFNGNPSVGEVRNKAFYDKMKSEMGAVKFATNTRLQVEMHKDMERLGDAFFS